MALSAKKKEQALGLLKKHKKDVIYVVKGKHMYFKKSTAIKVAGGDEDIIEEIKSPKLKVVKSSSDDKAPKADESAKKEDAPTTEEKTEVKAEKTKEAAPKKAN